MNLLFKTQIYLKKTLEKILSLFLLKIDFDFTMKSFVILF